MTSHTQLFPRDSYYFGGGMAFWENERGGISTSENDRMDTGEILAESGASTRMAGLIKDYISARDAFLAEKLAGVKASCPVKEGDTVRLKEPYGGTSDLLLVEKIAGFLVNGELGYAVIGRMLKKDGNPGKGKVITTALDIQEASHE